MPASPPAEAATVEPTLDARGLRCPEPVMLLHQALRPLSAGARLRVLTTDPQAHRDIRDFCRHLGHRLLESEEQDGERRFLLQKAPAPAHATAPAITRQSMQHEQQPGRLPGILFPVSQDRMISRRARAG